MICTCLLRFEQTSFHSEALTVFDGVKISLFHQVNHARTWRQKQSGHSRSPNAILSGMTFERPKSSATKKLAESMGRSKRTIPVGTMADDEYYEAHCISRSGILIVFPSVTSEVGWEQALLLRVVGLKYLTLEYIRFR